jgi:hypothetical protein
MPSLNLAQLSLVPNVGTILNEIVQFTGLQAPIKALESLKTLAQAGDFEPATLDAFLGDVDAVLSTVGAFIPGGKFDQLDAEVKKYKALVDAVEAGQSPVVATIDYTTKSGVKRELDLSISDKSVPVL